MQLLQFVSQITHLWHISSWPHNLVVYSGPQDVISQDGRAAAQHQAGAGNGTAGGENRRQRLKGCW